MNQSQESLRCRRRALFANLVPRLVALGLACACGLASSVPRATAGAAVTPPQAEGAAAGPPAPPPTAQGAAAAKPAPGTYAPLDVPAWAILHPEAEAKTRPWILIVDDPQCPYCMQLLLALEKERETSDPEIARAVVAELPYPLPYHDQSAHILDDAFCLEASRADRPWSAATYLDWLIVSPWKAEPDWRKATIDDLEKDGGFFDTKYDVHKVLSSRRREFQTETARAEAACLPGGCRGDADCEKLCASEKKCRAACPAAETGAAAPTPAPATGATAAPGSQAPSSKRDTCLADCASSFVSSRYRQFSKIHSACLLEEGPRSAHGKTAAAYKWGIDHKIPGTPTVYVGHPSIGFRTLGDSDHMADFLVLLREALAEARSKMAAVKS